MTCLYGRDEIAAGKRGHMFLFLVRAKLYTQTLLQFNGCLVTWPMIDV